MKIEELFVPYELALKLKEKGFDEECFAWYHCPTTYEDESLNHFTLKIYTPPLKLFKNGGGNLLIAPLYQQVIYWLYEREVKCEYNPAFTKEHQYDLIIEALKLI